jgi:hypothetical protein
VEQLREIMKQHGFSTETILDRLECFGGFREFTDNLQDETTSNIRD